MAWYALENIDQAVEETKAFLFPFDPWQWAKLAVIVFVVSGAGLPSSDTFGSAGEELDTESQDDIPQLDEMPDPKPSMTAATAAMPGVSDSLLYPMILLVVILAIGFAVLRSVFTFVFYRSLLTGEVQIVVNARRYAWYGVRLLGFSAAVLLVGGGILVGGGYYLMNAIQAGAFMPGLHGGLILLLIAVFLVLVLILHLTSTFIPLTMLQHDVPVLQAWRALYPQLREEWKQVAVYLVVNLFLTLAVGIIIGLLSLLLLIVPGIVVALTAVFAGLESTAAMIVIVLGGLFWIAAKLYALRVPGETFRWTYAILMYEDLTG